MIRRLRLRWVLLGLIALVSAGSAFGLGHSPAPTKNIGAILSSDSQCTAEVGVGLVVDFGQLNGNPRAVQACVKATPKMSGWSLLESAGVSPEGTKTYPAGFVCRLEGLPTTEAEPCDTTPDQRVGNWAYFYANPSTDFKWQYSAVGAASRTPKCGEVDGWRFESAGESATKPPALPATSHGCDD